MTERSRTTSRTKYFISAAMDAMMNECRKEDSKCQSYEIDRGSWDRGVDGRWRRDEEEEVE